MSKAQRITTLIVVAVMAVGAIIYSEMNKESRFRGIKKAEVIPISIMNKKEKAKIYPAAKEIVKPAGFINTDPITLKEIIGKKVILLDIWTFSCINCQRTLPYINSWYEKYKDQGLEIVSIHTPEFQFEQDRENVLDAVNRYNVKYPVVLDNDYGTWNAYGNRYWPRKYLIDIDGFVVYDHIGEGGYEETEKKIQELLKERIVVLGQKGVIEEEISRPKGVENVDATQPRSPEIYFGAWRNLRLGNGKTEIVGPQILAEPTGVKTNILYMVGSWDIQREFAENKSGQAKIIFRYQGEKVFMVAGSDNENGTNITILRDGKLVGTEGEGIGTEAGASVKNGKINVKTNKLYRLIEDPEGWGEHTLEIIIDNPGLQVFTFTFG